MSNVDVKTINSNDIFDNIEKIPPFDEEGIIPRITKKLLDGGYSSFHCLVSEDKTRLMFKSKHNPYRIIFDKKKENVIFRSVLHFPKVLEPEFVIAHVKLLNPIREYITEHEKNGFQFVMLIDSNESINGMEISRSESPSIEWIEKNVVQVMNRLHEVTIELNSVIEDVFKELMRELEEDYIREVIG